MDIQNPSSDKTQGTTHETKTRTAANPPKKLGILDGVVDQFGEHWIRFGTETRSCWFSHAELQVDDKEVFRRLSGPGMTLLTSKRRNAFKELIEGHDKYRPGFVAARPGWIGGHYVRGDGRVHSPRGALGEVIVTFEPNPKFTPTGTLSGWLADIAEVVANQTLPLLAVTYPYVGPLQRFAPSHVTNCQAEEVGEPETGKSTLGVLAASVWSGDPDSDVGGGETWDLTINALDRLKVAHADNFLFLDEGNLAGTDSNDQKQVIRKATFKLAAKGSRKRFTDQAAAPNANVAILSTSNKPLRELVGETGAVGRALQSRVVTIQIAKNRPYGVLDFIPEGFATPQAAIEHLRGAADRNYGVAGARFIERLVNAAANEEKLRRRG